MTMIPWQEDGDFRQAGLFFETMDKGRPGAFGRVRELAHKIQELLDPLDGQMERMCHQTCPECRNNCCARATVWYDFKDLLFLYFSGQLLPETQIGKKEKGNGTCCSHLTFAGCDLPRSQRPFICTWYICPAQTTLSSGVHETIRHIKILRQEMDDLFCRHCL